MLVKIKQYINKIFVNRNFALQIDESTDISSEAQFIGFIQFILDNKISNQFLFFNEFLKHSQGYF